MKNVKTILFSVAIVFVSLFLCSTGCGNTGTPAPSVPDIIVVPDTDDGDQVSVTGNAAVAIRAIKRLEESSPVLTVTLTDETTISDELRTAIRLAPAGKIKLDLSQTQMTNIPNTAFDKCNSLVSVTLPNSVTSIGEDAFSFCRSLVSVTIPEGVTNIGAGAFWLCSSLASVTIPNSVTTIGKSAFMDCNSLASVTIPNQVTSICDSMFNGCDSLASVNIPDSVTTIGKSAFYRCTSLASVTIPKNVTLIDEWAFYQCNSLASVTVKAETPPDLSYYSQVALYGRDVFSETASGLKIYVPSGSVDAYKNKSQTYGEYSIEYGWKLYASKIEAIQ